MIMENINQSEGFIIPGNYEAKMINFEYKIPLLIKKKIKPYYWLIWCHNMIMVQSIICFIYTLRSETLTWNI